MPQINVVLIEDEKSLLDVIEEGLVELYGCKVTALSDGGSGLAYLRENNAHLPPDARHQRVRHAGTDSIGR